MKRSEAKAFINSLLAMRTGAPDDLAITAPAVYETWTAGDNYTAGNRVLYDNVLYTVLQSHTAQEGREPTVAPSLFAEVLIPDATVIPEWEQPESTNPYKTGDKVTHNGSTWISTVDNNVWEPGVYGWEEVTADELETQ